MRDLPLGTDYRNRRLMATDRCPACGRGLRWGQCTDPACGWEPAETTPVMVRDPVDRPRPPEPTPHPTSGGHRPVGAPTAHERETGLTAIEQARQILAAIEDPPPLIRPPWREPTAQTVDTGNRL